MVTMAMDSRWWALALLPLLWLIWNIGFVQQAGRSTSTWGPRWLAISLSGSLHSFGEWYLNFSHNTEDLIKSGVFGPNKQYVIVWHPHGIYTVTAMYFLANWWAKCYPMDNLFVCVADLLLRVPGLSEFLLLCNARSGSAKTFDALLANGKSVAICPGGIAEQVGTNDEREVLYFPPRLGFIRMALKHGTPILPVYSFGENQLYVTSPVLRTINQWLYKAFGVGTMLIWGRGGLLCSPLFPGPWLLPMPGRSLGVRWGAPVDVGEPDSNPSDAKVQEIFDRYVVELRRVFDKHKNECLPSSVADHGLEIIIRGTGNKQPKKLA